MRAWVGVQNIKTSEFDNKHMHVRSVTQHTMYTCGYCCYGISRADYRFKPQNAVAVIVIVLAFESI